MEIFINGSVQQVNDHINLIDLIAILGITGRRLAIEVNKEIIPRSTYMNYYLKPNDHVEIVHAIGGG